jgi:hypothetical protein
VVIVAADVTDPVLCVAVATQKEANHNPCFLIGRQVLNAIMVAILCVPGFAQTFGAYAPNSDDQSAAALLSKVRPRLADRLSFLH